MKTARAARRRHLRPILFWLATFCAFAGLLVAQSPSAPAAAAQPAPATGGAAPATSQAPAAVHGVIDLDGPWRFQVGDDPQWADPAFDDSKWQTVVLSQTLTDQGIDTYSGYAWYRMRLQPQQLATFGATGADSSVDLLLTADSTGQLEAFVNGVQGDHSKGLTDHPSMYLSPPFVAHVPAASGNGSVVIAIRTWAAPGLPIHRGLLAKVELGTSPEVAAQLASAITSQWNENVGAALFLAFLFLCVALLGAALYVSQRNRSEYLWLVLLCAVAAVGRTSRALYGLASISQGAYNVVNMFAAYVFMAVTIEFVLRFTETKARRLVRGVQIGALLVPFLEFAPLGPFNRALPIVAEAAFCAVVTLLLFRAWRRGQRDAGVMLLPFFLASASDWITSVLEYGANLRWLPQQFASPTFHLGPIAFQVGLITDLIFLFSIIAVILYRFVRISEDEQRSTAEISAARSVQALLIPTQLPSNRNFMLESAYLPASGVGGDFFQVLPLKDDSLLIVVGDVSGKGLQAAMNASTLVGALRNELAHDPATVLDHLNRVLLGAVPVPGKVPELDAVPCFATCLCARIYPDGKMAIANAGHLSPYRDGREMELAPGLPLGVIANINYEQSTHQLNHGERIIFLSDGVVEATNEHGELFGFERTQQVSNEPARYIAQTAKRFGQNDDITVVSLYMASRTAHRANEAAAVTG